MDITSYIAEEIANSLGVSSSVIMNSDFDDLGLTSFKMTEIVERLSITFPELPITILYEFKNLQELIEFLKTNYNEIYEEKFQQSPVDKLVDLSNKDNQTDIAIIGMAGYFPGAMNIDEFWELLINGETSFSEIPIDRWNMHDFYNPDEDKSGFSYTKWGAFLKNIEMFDPLLFNISPRDAAKIDPQERLFLQIAYTALEDSGHINLLSKTEPTNVGVFVGVTNASYGWLENAHDEWRRIKHVNVSSAYWSVANRVSYSFNFSGPSLSLDTACSSSLTALHLACESLIRGECSYSIVGGVNLILHPRQYTELADMKMLSRGKQNKTFSDSADGFVYGEGVIALVLKPLHNAIVDNDRIYALIKSTNINANGKTSGYTVPSPNAQAELISKAINKSGFSASDVQYIECHGTGTKLGDPIEIRGLSKAFELTTNEKQYCALGSVKTNIGHLEASAGLAGVVKTALQIANKRLVPNILVEPLNRKIDFSHTPFYLVKEVQTWPRENAPLVACVSSFGAGGANAHAILSSSSLKKINHHELDKRKIYLMCISANHPTSLRQKLEDLYSYLKHTREENTIGNIVYTINNCRLHYPHRMAFIFGDKSTLETQLLDVIINEIPLNFYSSTQEIKQHHVLNLSQVNQLINDDPSETELSQLAIAYVNGVEINWSKLYKSDFYQAIKLPTYPFLKERCWITDDFANKRENINSRSEHPFLFDINIEQKICSKMFTGNDYAFKEHVLQGEKIFPGVCHIEMVLAAYAKIYRSSVGELSEITWLAPINLTDDCCEIILCFKENKEIISYQLGKNVGGEFLLCSQGKISTEKIESTWIDILSYRENLSDIMDGNALYTFFREKGWYHGPAFQSVKHLYYNNEKLVADIQLPDFFVADDKIYGLNPGMMDGILQAITILNMRLSIESNIALPFYLQSLEIINPLPKEIYALVTLVDSAKKHRSKTFNVTVTDLDGNVCLKLTGFIMAAMQEKIRNDEISYFTYNSIHSNIFDKYDTALINNSNIYIIANRHDFADYYSHSDIVIFLYEQQIRVSGSINPFPIKDRNLNVLIPKFFKRKAQNYSLINLVDMNNTNDLSELVDFHISFIQMLLKEHVSLKFVFSCEFMSYNLRSLGSCLPGFYKSLHAENSFVNTCHLVMENSLKNTSDLKEKISTIIHHNFNYPELHLTSGGFKYVELVQIKSVESRFHFKRTGTYLIVGGFGGLGQCLTRQLVSEYDADVIIMGRSSLDEYKQTFLQECNKNNKKVYYYQVDICCLKDLENTYKKIKLDFPLINGLFHLAAITKDDFFVKKEMESFKAVCSVKIDGALNLDSIFATEPLDFFVLFSSIVSILGNRGQTDYSAANAWFDRFAFNRQHLVEKGQRFGITTSINWPFMSDGGFQIEDAYLDWMRTHWGMLPMSAHQYFNAISTALSYKLTQVMPFIGDNQQLINYYNKDYIVNSTSQKEEVKLGILPNNEQHDTLQLENEIKNIVSHHQKIKIENINVNTDLTNYGYSSISFTELSTLINEKYAIATTPAIFFDATCIRDICILLEEDYPEVFATYSDNILSDNVQQSPAAELVKTSNNFDDPIAIIGYHACLPGADSAEDFWSNLELGLDSISEIPADRWCWQDFYGAPETGDFTYSKWGGFISDISKFDAKFFGISPREAELMDPQQRIFLQSVYYAMEHSGYTKQTFSEHKTGLYVGVSLFEYGKLLQQYAEIDAYTSSGTVHSIVANRVSYLLDLTGPSIALDTACSSSLVAIHEAVKALRYGDCELAIAGGVNALLEPSFYIAFDKAGMLSRDGKCKAFDESANGYVRGEGVATLILKPLSKALQDSDTIYGVIKGSGVNHGGHSQTLTSPNPNAQAEIIVETFQKAQVPFNTIQYVECHGTGTPLGDPVEVNGLKKAYQKLQYQNIELQQDFKCGIGSVKTNIGHLESSAGVAGVIKILLMMQNKKLVKTLNFSKLNPYIDLKNSPFYVVDRNESWVKNSTANGQIIPLRAAVSGFGFGGANAHIILEEPPIIEKEYLKNKPAYLITLSAVNEELLSKKIQQLFDWLNKNTDSHHDEIESISFTLNQGREHFKSKFSCVANDSQELLKILNNYLKKEKTSNFFIGNDETNDDFSSKDFYHQLLEMKANKSSYRHSLERLAQGYIQGKKIDWTQLHQDENNCRIALPLYPFAKKHYWFTKRNTLKPVVSLLNKSEKALNDYCYKGDWEKFSFDEFSKVNSENENTLVIYFDEKIGASIKDFFSLNSAQFILLNGESHHSNTYFTIDKSDVFSYIDTISSFASIDVIYFFCSKTSIENDLIDRYLTSFYRFIKALIQMKYDNKKLNIKIITFGITNILDTQPILSSGAGIQGFSKVLSNEYSNWQIDQFDLPSDIALFPNEIRYSSNYSGCLFLYRNNEWLRQIIVPQKLNRNANTSALKEKGVYLIIGGLGGIGTILIDYLENHYQATVIIVGRKSLDEVNEKYKHKYIQCDISQETEVIALNKSLLNLNKQINGVFQCAMVLKDQSIRLMSEATLLKVIEPKFYGTFNILNIIGESVKDFIAIFSSTESYFALAGQSNYTAASWLQDQVAEHFYCNNKKIKLIHWGLWEEVGAASDKRLQQKLQHFGFIGLKNNDAIQLLELALLDNNFEITLLGVNEKAKSFYPVLSSTVEKFDPYNILNKHTLSLLWAAFNNVGFWTETRKTVTYHELVMQTNSSKTSQRMLNALLILLEKYHFIAYQPKDNAYTLIANNNYIFDSSTQDVQQTILEYPTLKPFLEALMLTSTNLFKVLQGHISAIELMCPDGDFSLLKSFYFNNPIVNDINLRIAEKVEMIIKRKLETRSVVRIIEIGAGCGGATQSILNLLRENSIKIEYLFSDISPSLIESAKNVFSNYSNIQFKQLDIESYQDFDSDYDLLIASNVLHATKDIKHTLNNCKRLLKNDGELIINEVIDNHPFLTLIFGVFPGWWAFDDLHRQTNSPLIAEVKWSQLLAEVGLCNIEISKSKSPDPHTLIYASNTCSIISENKYQNCQLSPNDILIEMLCPILKFSPDEVNPLISFSDLGLDSITGVSFITKVNKKFNTNFPVNIIFSYKNVTELGDAILLHQRSQTRSLVESRVSLLFEE